MNRLQSYAGSEPTRVYVTHCLHGDFGSFTFTKHIYIYRNRLPL